MKKFNIDHAGNSCEYFIQRIGYVDGYCVETNTIYEIHGLQRQKLCGALSHDEINMFC